METQLILGVTVIVLGLAQIATLYVYWRLSEHVLANARTLSNHKAAILSLSQLAGNLKELGDELRTEKKVKRKRKA